MATSKVQNVQGIETATDTSGVVTVTYRKSGRVVCCTFPSISSRSVAGWGTINLGTIPEGFRPVANTGYLCIARQYQTNTIPLFFIANQDGRIYMSNQGDAAVTTGTIMSSTFTWLTAE